VIVNLLSFLLYQLIEIVNIVTRYDFLSNILCRPRFITTQLAVNFRHGGSTVVVVIPSLFSEKSKTVAKTKKKVESQMVAEEKGIFA